MKNAILTLMLLFPALATAAELTDAEQASADTMCEAYANLAHVSFLIQTQKSVEAASGVRDLDQMRKLGEEFHGYYEDVKASLADPFVKSHQIDCNGVDAKERAAMLKQIAEYEKAIGVLKGK